MIKILKSDGVDCVALSDIPEFVVGLWKFANWKSAPVTEQRVLDYIASLGAVLVKPGDRVRGVARGCDGTIVVYNDQYAIAWDRGDWNVMSEMFKNYLRLNPDGTTSPIRGWEG